MSKESTMQAARRAAEAGDYASARDRLQGLLATYPDDLEIRARLGEAYWQLGNPVMAGRYWYLEEGFSPEMLNAKAAFERSCGDRAERILRMLKFKGDIESIRDTPAGRTLLALQERAEAERPQASLEDLQRLAEWRKRSAITFYSCLGIALFAVLLFAAGIIFVLAKYL